MPFHLAASLVSTKIWLLVVPTELMLFCSFGDLLCLLAYPPVFPAARVGQHDERHSTTALPSSQGLFDSRDVLHWQLGSSDRVHACRIEVSESGCFCVEGGTRIAEAFLSNRLYDCKYLKVS